MNRSSKGFTLIELIIVVAIIAILVALAFSAFPRKAGAQTVAPSAHSPVWTFLNTNDIPFVYVAQRRHLTILNNGTDASRWATAVAACEELRAKDETIEHVTLWNIGATSSTTELSWGGSTVVGSVNTMDDASCL